MKLFVEIRDCACTDCQLIQLLLIKIKNKQEIRAFRVNHCYDSKASQLQYLNKNAMRESKSVQF